MIAFAPLGEKHTASEVLDLVVPSTDPYGLTLVDETRVWELLQIATGAVVEDHATRVTFTHDKTLIGYAAFGEGTSDFASDTNHRLDCLGTLATLTGHPGHVWVRGVAPSDVDALGQVGVIRRALAVLTCPLTHDRQMVGDEMIRAFVPGVDDACVVGVLARAYAGTPEGDWTPQMFATRMTFPWFRADDLLVAVTDDGHVAGVHWMKQRNHKTGEVYNLAVDPAYAGQGYGARLLSAGMQQMAHRGLTQMVLWVDVANEPALRVYRAAGFSPHTVDVELVLSAG